MAQPIPANRSSAPLLWNLLKTALAIGLILLILSKTDASRLYSVLAGISVGWLTLSVALYILLSLMKAFQYYLLIGRRVDYPKVLNIVVVQNALSNFVAAGAGIASYLSLFRMEHGLKLSRAALAFILTKVGDLISIWLFMLIAGLWVWSQIVPLHLAIQVLLAAIGALVLAFFAAVALRRRFVSGLRAVLQRLNLERIDLVARGLTTLQNLVEQDPAFIMRMIGIGILYSILYMLVTSAWIYSILQTFSLPIGLMPAVFVNTLIQLLSYLPIQVLGGLGVTEVTYLYLYGFFDLTQAEIAPVLVGFRALFYLSNLLVLLYVPMYTLFSRSRAGSS